MSTNHSSRLFNSNFFTVIYFLAFYGMLHSSIVAPAQNLIIAIDNFTCRTVSNIPARAGIVDTNRLPEHGSRIESTDKTLLDSERSHNKSVELANLIYTPDITSGQIGYVGISFDNPEDNVFHFSIEEIPSLNDQVVLKYDLLGASNNGSLAKSINSRPSTGGCVAKKSNTWTTITEEISSDWLKKGDNTLIFTIDKLAGYNCEIRNIRLEVKKGMQIKQLIFTDYNTITQDGKLYVKGFVKNASESNVLIIENTEVKINNDEFQAYIPIKKTSGNTKLKAVLYNGTEVSEVESLNIKQLKIADFNALIEEYTTVSGIATQKANFSISCINSSILIPSSALEEETSISVSKLRKIDLPPLNPGLINVTKEGAGYRFTPDGIKFNESITLNLQYDSTLIPGGSCVNDIQTYFFNTESKRWEAVSVDSIDIETQTVISKTNHFTDYINGIIQVPEGPQSTAYTPTMMNDIKAADPAANMNLISPPSASQTGEATISYPLTIPSGRKGMQPNLAIQYNSDGGSGWLGQGWSINLPAISIDTRWGVPMFGDKNGDGIIKSIPENNLVENEIETEIYLLNGEQMMYPKYKETDWMPNRHYDVGSAISTEERPKIDKAVFTLRKQGGFEKIERLGDSPYNYFWKVTSTDGTISWYGAKTETDFEQGKAAVVFNSNGFIVHWALVQTIDVHGNNVNYYYDKGTYTNQSSENANLKGGHYFYPQRITYTGKGSSDGQYSVYFNKESADNQPITRTDPVINGRLGLKQVDPYILGNITIKFQNNIVRSYSFNYLKSEAFNKTLLNRITENDQNSTEFYHHDLEYYDDILVDGARKYYTSGEEVDIEAEQCYSAEFRVPGFASSVPYYHYSMNYSVEIPLDYCSDKTRAKLSELMINQGNPSIPVTDLFLTHQPTPSCPPIPVTSSILDPVTQNVNFENDCLSFLSTTLSSLQPREIKIENNSGIYRNESNQIVNVNNLDISFDSDIDASVSYKMECPLYSEYDVATNFSKRVDHRYCSLPVTIYISSSASSDELIGTYPDLSNPVNLQAFEDDLNTHYGGIPEPFVVMPEDGNFKIVIPNTQLRFYSIKSETSLGSEVNDFQSCSGSGSHTNGYSNLKFLFPLVTPTFNANASLLGSTKSLSTNSGIYLGGGVGKDPTSKKTTVGVQFTGGLSKSEGFLTMADIDGDGLDDIILKMESSITYRKHIVTRGYNQYGKEVITHNFLDSRPVLGDINNFYCEKGLNGSINGQVTYGVSGITGFAGIDGSGSMGETNIFLTDANGDGLIDVAKNGTVYFNRIDNGLPRFEADSKLTENMVIKAAATLIETPPITATTEQTFPACDVVKVWEAPADGEIQIKNDIYLTDNKKETQVTIEMDDKVLECYSSEFPIRNRLDFYSYLPYIEEVFPGDIGEHSFCLFPNEIPIVTAVKRGNGSPYFATQDNLVANHFENGIITNKCPDGPIYSTDGDYIGMRNENFYTDYSNFLNGSPFSNDPYYIPSPWNVSKLYYDDIKNKAYYINNVGYRYVNYYCHNNDTTFVKIIKNYQEPYTYDEVALPCYPFFPGAARYPVYYNLDIRANDQLYHFVSSDWHLDNFEDAIENTFNGCDATITYTKVDDITNVDLLIANTSLQFESIRVYMVEDKPPFDDNTYLFQQCNSAKEIISENKPNVNDDRPFGEPNEFNVPLNLFLHLKDDNDSPYRLLLNNKDYTWYNSSGEVIKDPLIVSYIEQQLPYEREKFYLEFKDSVIESLKLDDKLISSNVWLADSIQQTYKNQIREIVSTPMCLLFGAKLNESSNEVHNIITANSCNYNNPLAVTKGDKIYFRVHNIENGDSPIQWDPEISYIDPVINTIVDENNVPVSDAKYSDGFILSQDYETFPPEDAMAHINWTPINIEGLTDNVTFEIYTTSRTENELGEIIVDENVFRTYNIPAGSSLYFQTSEITYGISRDISLGFRVKSKSNVDWKKINWKPVVTFTYNLKVKNPEGVIESEIPMEQTVYPVVDYSIYKSFPGSMPYNKYNMTTVVGTNKSIKLGQFSSIPFDSKDNGSIYLVLKGNNALIGTREITVTNGSCAYNSVAIPIPSEVEDLEIGFYTDDSHKDIQESLMRHLVNASIPLLKIVADQQEYDIIWQRINLMHKPDPLFGPMYRNWGQFFYNPLALEEQGVPIGNGLTGYLLNPDVFFLSQTQSEAMDDNYTAINEEQLQNINLDDPTALQTITNNISTINEDIKKVPFVKASPARIYNETEYVEKWHGFHEENYATKFKSKAAGYTDVNSAYFNPDDEITQDVISTGAYSVSRITEGGASNASAGISVGINATVGVSGSRSWNIGSRLLTDFVDYNGDRYPDIIDKNNIQPTVKTGGLGESTMNKDLSGLTISGDISKSEGASTGAGASGSFPSGGQSATGASGSSTGGKFSLKNPFMGKPVLQSNNGNSSIGISGQYSTSDITTSTYWADINGDGIIDKLNVVNDDHVEAFLSYGNNKYDPYEVWFSGILESSHSQDIGGGCGISLKGGSIEGGVSVNKSQSSSLRTFVDLNSDGLLDLLVLEENELNAYINDGNSFETKIENLPINLNENSEVVSASAHGTITAAWITPIFGFPLKFPCLSFTQRFGYATNRTLKSIMDYDGDGYQDIVQNVDDNTIKIWYSTIKRTNKLKTVTNPLGGSFTIDYRVGEKTYDNPNAKWNMYSVTLNDGDKIPDDGTDIQYKTFEYKDGKYDRREREFYGFAIVKTHDHIVKEDGVASDEIYRTQENNYCNRNYYLKGLLKESKVYKENNPDSWFSHQINTYVIKPLAADNSEIDLNAGNLDDNFDVGGSEGRHTACALLSSSETHISDGNKEVFSMVDMKYDNKGRVLVYNKYNDNSTSDIEYTTEIKYHSIQSLVEKNIINIPSEITVLSKVGKVFRNRIIPVDGVSSYGDITKILAMIDDITYAETLMEYDPTYGNLTRITLPQNKIGQRMYYQYTYDPYNFKNIIAVTDAFGYESSFSYDNKYDVMTSQTDISESKISYEYDNVGRLTRVTGPNELASGAPYTLAFDYCPQIGDFKTIFGTEGDPKRFMPVAVTHHYDQQHPGDDLLTYTFCDGFDRPVQVKKDVVINSNTNRLLNPNFVTGLSVSGFIVNDFVGRVINQYQPVFEVESISENVYPFTSKSAYFSLIDYDEIDRIVRKTDEAGNIIDNFYSIEDGCLKTRNETDQDGTVKVITEIYKDISDKLKKNVSLDKAFNGQIQTTTYSYNEIGELISYTDPVGLTSNYTYDNLGQKKTYTHPDQGKTSYIYDRAGNLISMQTANLVATGKWITYDYEYNRLTAETYPTSGVPIMNTTYKYGAPGTGPKTGRLIEQTDATGRQYFDYGLMGEMIYNERVVIAPNIPVRIFKTRYTYDSWNRINKIIYPDNEVVHYNYNRGGNLYSIKDSLNASSIVNYYIKRMDYNVFEQKTFAQYGIVKGQSYSSTVELYDYDVKLRRLERLQVGKLSAGVLTNYIDAAYGYDKIGNIKSISNACNPYQYSPGKYIGGKYSHSYNYDAFNRLTSAVGSYNSSNVTPGVARAAYNLSLVKYDPSGCILNKNQEHSKVFGIALNTYTNSYTYKTNTHQISTITNTANNNVETFIYDRNGNLTSRNGLSSQTFIWDDLNRLSTHSTSLDVFNYYYDASGDRIVKSVGSKSLTYTNHDLQNSELAVRGTYTYPSGYLVTDPYGNYSKHYYNGSQRIASRVGDGTCARFEKNTDESADLQKMQKESILENARALGMTDVKYEPYSPVSLEELQESDSSRAVGTISIYYYHPDHLGTNTLITDMSGNPSQFFLNLPFGEPNPPMRRRMSSPTPIK